MMRVVLEDGSTHEVDARNVALLHANSNIHLGFVPSRDIFTRFAEFFVKHREVPQPQGLADWDRQFMDQILDAKTLSSFRRLGQMAGQVELVDLCRTRAIELEIGGGNEEHDGVGRGGGRVPVYGDLHIGDDAGTGEVDNNVGGVDGGSEGIVEDAGEGGGITGDGSSSDENGTSEDGTVISGVGGV